MRRKFLPPRENEEMSSQSLVSAPSILGEAIVSPCRLIKYRRGPPPLSLCVQKQSGLASERHNPLLSLIRLSSSVAILRGGELACALPGVVLLTAAAERPWPGV